MENKTDLLLAKMEAIISKVDFDQVHIAMLLNDWATDIYIYEDGSYLLFNGSSYPSDETWACLIQPSREWVGGPVFPLEDYELTSDSYTPEAAVEAVRMGDWNLYHEDWRELMRNVAMKDANQF